MANVDNPHGLRPLMRTLDGGSPSCMEFAKVVGTGTAAFINDVVQRGVSGDVTPGIGALTAGVNLVYGAASTATTHIVMTSPGAVYEAQDNADTDGFVLTDMGANCDLEAGAGSATTFISGHEIDESAINTTNSLHVHLIQKLNVPDNAWGSHVRIEIVFNVHAFNGNTAGVTT